MFFGTPFLGTPYARAATMWASFSNVVGPQQFPELLKSMDPESQVLKDLVVDLRYFETKALKPDIKLYYLYERVTTNFTKLCGSSAAGRLVGGILPDVSRPRRVDIPKYAAPGRSYY